MKAITQNYIGTTIEWVSENPVIYDGVWAFEITDTAHILAKIGNGKDSWNSLAYWGIDNVHNLRETLTATRNDTVEIINDKINAETEKLNNHLKSVITELNQKIDDIKEQMLDEVLQQAVAITKQQIFEDVMQYVTEELVNEQTLEEILQQPVIDMIKEQLSNEILTTIRNYIATKTDIIKIGAPINSLFD